MTICIKADEDYGKKIPRPISIGTRSLPESLVPRESPSSLSVSKHIVIAIDGLKEFSKEALQWALDHVIGSGSVVTLLTVMPWLNLPLSSKTWLDPQDLPALKERSEWKSDPKYQKVRGIVELCDQYGVVPNMKVAMGYPFRRVVMEQTMILNASWVIVSSCCCKHHKKNRAFFAKRIPCNVVMMNADGEVDQVKVPSMMIDNGRTTPVESPVVSLPLVPRAIKSEPLILRPIREQEEYEVDWDI